MTNEEILKSARMRLKDVHTGKEGYTLAAALLFGKENTLASVLPHYKTDALCRKVDTVIIAHQTEPPLAVQTEPPVAHQTEPFVKTWNSVFLTGD